MESHAPTVTIAQGTLAGTLIEGVRSFKGIPFAGTTAGAARWRPPSPAPTWTGTRDASAFGPEPIQPPRPDRRSRAPGNDEDSLSLNLWVPEGDGPFPVMVWLEGGSFMTGGGAGARIDGAALARMGVVLITLNYRLSVFGFLAHPLLTAESPHHASSNYGLMDQIAALRWVRENVAAFGGDAGRVTVFGVSAGSASIALLITSPLAKGLFDQAILHSPGSLRPLATLADAEAAGAMIGNDLAALRALPAAEALAFNAKISPGVRGLTTPRLLRPICDGYVVPQQESVAYESGAFAHIPLMVGSTANEGGWAVRDMPINTVAEFTAYMQQNFGDATSEALERYPVRHDEHVKAQLAEVFGDTQFTYGARGIACASARFQPKTYRYVFNHGSAGHADDTPYVFGNGGEAFDENDWIVSRMMMAAWTQFAKTGDPNVPGALAWPAYDPAHDTFFEFAVRPDVRHGWRTSNLDFLQRYFAERATG
jgi:carboxylesterase type B